jgi:hypothetical protein
LAAGGKSMAVQMWDVKTRTKLASVKTEFAVRRLCFSPDGRSLATVGDEGTLRVWETLTGRERVQFTGQGCKQWSVAFSLNGQTVASGGDDGMVLIWDLTGGQIAMPGPPSAEQREEMWEALTGGDASGAYRGLCSLAADGTATVRFLKEHVRPVADVKPETFARLVMQLDHDDFDKREKASAELERLATLKLAALRKTLATTRSAEQKRRLELLVEHAEEQLQAELVSPGPKTLREVRVVELLERLATPEARELLKTLAGGAEDARLTREAQASLKRLNKR